MIIIGNSIGVDYHQKGLQISVRNAAGKQLGNRRIANDIRSVVEYVGCYGAVSAVAVEACTGSANFADSLRLHTNWEVQLCHPGYVQRMRANPDKSDLKDSEILSDLLRVGYLPKVWLAPEEIRDLRTLLRYRATLVTEQKDKKLRVRAILREQRILCPGSIKDIWCIKGMRWLESFTPRPKFTAYAYTQQLESIKALAIKITESSKLLLKWASSDPVADRLMQEKGIGTITAVALRVEIGSFSRFNNGKQLARFCGMSPRNTSTNQNGSTAGLIKAGNSLLRAVLVQVGHNIARYHPTLRELAKKLRSAGKPRSVVIAAIVNRWLRKLFYLMRDFEQNKLTTVQ